LSSKKPTSLLADFHYEKSWQSSFNGAIDLPVTWDDTMLTTVDLDNALLSRAKAQTKFEGDAV
jgi:hypothetical protein